MRIGRVIAVFILLTVLGPDLHAQGPAAGTPSAAPASQASSAGSQNSLPDAPQPRVAQQPASSGAPPAASTAQFDAPQEQSLPPMTAKEKLHYAVSNSVDPLAIIEAAAKAGFYQETGFRSKYGGGASGYFKQFGASAADGALREFDSNFLFASLLHQDPRYYHTSHRSFSYRMGYALSRVFVTRGDSGQTEFNWSSVLGSAAAAGMSNVYLPAKDRTASMAVGNFGWFLVGEGFNRVLEEFMPNLYHRLKHT